MIYKHLKDTLYMPSETCSGKPVHLVVGGRGGGTAAASLPKIKYLIPNPHLWAILTNPLHILMFENVYFMRMLEKMLLLQLYSISPHVTKKNFSPST